MPCRGSLDTNDDVRLHLQMRPGEYWVDESGKLRQIRRPESLDDHLALFQGLDA